MKKISPVKNKSLRRRPGYSLQLRLRTILVIVIFGILCPCFFGLGFFIRGLIDIYSTTFSVVMGAFLFAWIVAGAALIKYKLDPLAEQLFQGRDGEIATGESLEELRSFGWKVFHDFEYEYAKGKKANIDHIVVAPQGVFLIETKTVAKIEGDNEKMTFDGKQIIFQKSGKTISLPVAQVEASAKYLQHFFFQRLGLKIDIKQIVVYPGWFMDWTREGAIPHAPIWACPPCYVRSRIQYEKEPVLNQTDFERVCNELESANRI